ncbi:MAG: hypothetical protein JWR44_1766 [Hymenobacter sp.]|nr:hypothetical protein [Hymenobacter sp.]
MASGNPGGASCEFTLTGPGCPFGLPYLCPTLFLLPLLTRFLAFFLAVLMLFQTLGQEVLVVDYQLNKARITELYCVNKARPTLHCNGKCHLMQQLRKADGAEKKAPAGAMARVKYEMLPTAHVAVSAPRRGPRPAPCYPAAAVTQCAGAFNADVFRPPLLLG